VTGKHEDFFEFAKILGQQTEFEEVLKIVAHKSAQILQSDLALILMLNPDTRETIKTIIKDGKSIDQKEYHPIRIHVGGWIVDEGKPFISDAIQTDERFIKGLFENTPIKSVAGVPLLIEGIIIGALIVLYEDSKTLVNTGLIQSLENIAAIAVPFLRNVQKIRQYFPNTVPESTILLKYNNTGLIGKSPRFIELLQDIEAATKCDTRVLLIGKTGTGKELIAKAIHNFSSRADGPFIATDCGAIPNTLLESEFFGHARGAFTGAYMDRQGLFMEANGGTLFLDEINNLSFDMQSKFLRVLEDGEVRPIGSDKMVKTDVRIITASSIPLKKLVEEKLFREDLFFRLYVYPISIPDLSERKRDIPLLANHFLHLFTKKQNKKAKNLHEEVIDYIKHRAWTGNIRELENFVERIVTVAPVETSIIEESFFPAELKKEFDTYRMNLVEHHREISLKEQLNICEKEIIEKALVESDWNQSETARKLHTSEGNIRHKMSQYNITQNDIR
jgi:transcriptional regulator with GAF, ATPase, and Fis domain